MGRNLGYTDEDGEFHAYPTKWEICPHCRGEGKSSAYLGAFTADQMRDDPDFMEDYFAGNYDRTCEDCKGSGKVQEVDMDRMSKEDLDRLHADDKADAEYEAERRAEYLFCGGWREEGWR